MDTPFVNPPIYSAIAVTNFFAVIFGLIFKDMLEYQVNRWQANRDTQPTVEYQTPGIVITYLLTCLFTILFLTACFMVIGINVSTALAIAGILTAATAALIWFQLGSLLTELVAGGSAALDIDSFGGAEESIALDESEDPENSDSADSSRGETVESEG